METTESDLLAFKNFGETSLKEIKAILSTKSLHLAMALEEQPQEAAEEPPAPVVEENQGLLNKPVDELQLSVRAKKCLQKLNLHTIKDLTQKTEAELLGVKNFGVTSLNEIKKALTDLGLRRPANEDSFVSRPGLGLHVVCDGMGGHAAGEIASRVAADNPGPRPPGMGDVEWQTRDWYDHLWLSGDVTILLSGGHSVDKMSWWQDDVMPVKAVATGSRVYPAEGNTFDNGFVAYEYASGIRGFLACRSQSGCYSENADYVIGSTGVCSIGRGLAPVIQGQNEWRYTGVQNNKYQTEHDELFASIRPGHPINDGTRMAHTTLMAILGRMAAYTDGLMDTAVVKIPFLALEGMGRPADPRAFQFNRLMVGLTGNAPPWPRYLHGELLHLTSLLYHPLIERMPFDSRLSKRLFFTLKSALGVVTLFFPDRIVPGNRQVLADPGSDRVRLCYRESADKEAFMRGPSAGYGPLCGAWAAYTKGLSTRRPVAAFTMPARFRWGPARSDATRTGARTRSPICTSPTA